MIRDQFKDVKKVTAKEARKKAAMGEKKYYAKQISKYQDLSKSVGISMAVRTLSPDIIICDEIGVEDIDEIIKFVYKNPFEFNLFLGSLYFVSETRPKLKA